MREKTELFQIGGKPMLVPDVEVVVSYSDLDASDSGRDESGYMHRIVVRHKVGSWKFTYAHLTEEEKQYRKASSPMRPPFSSGIRPGKMPGHLRSAGATAAITASPGRMR